MIFAAQQLVEKTGEHDNLLFVLFLDLRKAYDSVPMAFNKNIFLRTREATL